MYMDTSYSIMSANYPKTIILQHNRTCSNKKYHDHYTVEIPLNQIFPKTMLKSLQNVYQSQGGGGGGVHHRRGSRTD